MSMRKGEPTTGLEFYSLLCEDDGFCAELGRAVLAAGRLESVLKRYLLDHAPEADTTRATLGRLINYSRRHRLLSRMLPSLDMLKTQRNYLTHNIHSLLSGLVEETILEGSELLDSDVDTYTDQAWQLKENLNALAAIVEKDITKNCIGPA